MIMKNSLKYYRNSILVKLIITLLVFCIPFSIFSIASIYQSRNILIEKIETAHQNMLQTYMQQINTEMKNARSYTNSLTFYNSITLPLTINPESSAFHFASNKLKQDVQSTLMNYRCISGFFLYIPKTEFYFTKFNDKQSISAIDEFKSFLKTSVISESNGNSKWVNYSFENTDYFIEVTYRNGIYSGCYVNLDTLPEILPSEKEILYVPLSTLNQVQKNLDKHTFLLSETSNQSDLCIYELIDTNSLFNELPFIQKYIIIISIFIVLLIPLLFIILNRMIIFPLQKLTKAMIEIQNGNADYRIKAYHFSNEFNQVNATFNDMMYQLKELKIEVYEEKLNHQKARLNNLQIQLRPHFMVNSLNMVYNLISNKEQNTALNLIRFSVNYLRYMLKIKEDFVPLNEELEHIKNYLNIQLLRYSNHFSYTMDIDPFIETILVPPLFIQNFIENSLKYSISPDKKTEIKLKIDYKEVELEPYIHIVLRDNGKGYPAELLEPLNNQSVELLSNSVGLKNSLERAKILYNGKASLLFYNDNGAVSEFIFPIK